jgi:hypothetical protein
MLVWSQAWNAEGEKGKTRYWLKHTPASARVPAGLPFMNSRARKRIKRHSLDDLRPRPEKKCVLAFLDSHGVDS